MITFRVDHSPMDGFPIIVKIYDNGSEESQAANPTGAGPLRAEFDVWNATQLPPLVVAIVPPVVVPQPVIDYATPFVANVMLWGRIHKALDDNRTLFIVAGNTPTTILANLKLQVNAAVAVVLTAPQGVIDEFQKERVLQGSTLANVLPATINALTVSAANIQQLLILVNVARQVADQGLAIVGAFNSFNG